MVLLIIAGLLSVSVFNIAKHHHARTIRDDYQKELDQIKEHERLLKEKTLQHYRLIVVKKLKLGIGTV